ncbi:MAG: hypothetical protein HY741_09090 [Chloroflexi bacterium]|nr:hypothetical protein [Chloroflexota bacterium]
MIKSLQLGEHSLQTPNLFASYRLGDVTSAGVKFFPWKITNTQAVLVNAYDLIENPKCSGYRNRLAKENKTIREHIEFNGPLMIDSGAYYFLRSGHVHISPTRVLQVEQASGADLGVVLDHPFPPKATDKQARINRTLDNTRKMFAAFDSNDATLFDLLPVVHGHDPKTIQKTIDRLEKIAEKHNGGRFDKVGIGSLAPLAQNGNKELAVQVLTEVRRQLPDVYLHCFSMGSSLLMLLAFYCGADTVDSQTWIMSAAFKFVQLPGHHIIRLATRERAANPYQYQKRLSKMKELIFRLYDEEDFFVKDWETGEILDNPNEDDLDQYIATMTDRKGHRHLHNRACHNLWVFNFEAKRARAEIEKGRFEEFVDSRLKNTKYYKAFLCAKGLKL